MNSLGGSGISDYNAERFRGADNMNSLGDKC